jgi:LysM repeat protein
VLASADVTIARTDPVGIAVVFTSLTPISPGPSSAPGPTIPPALLSPQTYTVVSGDTIARIAGRFGLSTADLLAANQQIGNGNDIKPGDHLTIPTK